MHLGFCYLAAVEVSPDKHLPDRFVKRRIPTQEYAVFTFVGGTGQFPENLHKFVHYIWSVWLPKSEYETTGSPDFECYDGRFNPLDGTGEFDIFVPVRRLSA